MSRKNSTLQIFLYLTCVFILLAGLVGATIIYVRATDDMSDAVSNQSVGGYGYAISPHDSKQYLSDLENYGGTVAVLADDFNWWFAGLWHGKRLAYTLTVLVIGAALVCYLITHFLFKHPSQCQTEDRTKDDTVPPGTVR